MSSKYQRTGDRPYRGRGRGGFRGTSHDNDPQFKAFSGQQPAAAVPDTPMTAMFRSLSEALDEKNDLYELLVKNSRDTTIEAKRIIFLLIRCAGKHPGSVEVHQLLTEAKDRLRQLEGSALRILANLLIGQDPLMFNRAFTPGLQEYIEALSLHRFVENGQLISLAEVQKRLQYSEDGLVYALQVTPVDFLLGIGDLTGELMRFSITHAASSTTQSAVFALCDFARLVLIEYQRVPYGVGREFGIKSKVMEQSVFKIERVCYQLALRKAENLPSLPGFALKLDEPETIVETY